MSRPNVCVSPDLSVEGLTSLLLERGLTAVSVVDGEGELVGVVSTTDLLREVQDRNGGEERVPLRASSPLGVQVEFGEGFHATTLARATVEEILTPFAFTLPATASVAQAAALLTHEGLDQVAVLGPEDQIVGARPRSTSCGGWRNRVSFHCRRPRPPKEVGTPHVRGKSDVCA